MLMKSSLKSLKLKYRKNSLLRFLLTLIAKPFRASLFLVTLMFLFLLPGQNYYQTRILVSRPPLVRASQKANFLPSDYPVKKSEQSVPELSAKSAVAVDATSGVILYAKDPNEKLHPASITKLMTALVALDYYPLDRVLTVKRLVNGSEESEMGLKVGDRLTVKNLLYGLLIPSGNDAAYTLADNYPGGIENFIYSMNQKARELSLFNTHFENPSGLDQDNHYMSSRDISRLAMVALKQPLIAEIVGTNWASVTDISGKKHYPLQNVNQLLLSYRGTFGIKTGFTDDAGQCLAAAIKRGSQTVITVVLKSDDRFADTKLLAGWVFRNFTETPAVNL